MRKHRLLLQYVFVTVALTATPVLGQSERSSFAGYDYGHPPEVVVRSPPAVRAEWARIIEAMKRPNPPKTASELLVRRGYLLLSVHARARAYSDFRLAASTYVDFAASNEEVRDRTLTVLHMLKRGRKTLRFTPSHNDGGFNEYYGEGYHSFWRGEYARALEYFDLALELEPYEPTCHYYQALTHRCRADHKAAEDAMHNAAFWEFQALRASYGHPPSPTPSRVNQALERVQGCTRLWLESFRPPRTIGDLDTPRDVLGFFGRDTPPLSSALRPQ